MLENHTELKEAIDFITLVFGGDDGGIPFVKFCSTMERFANEAKDGNTASQELITLVLRFKKLLEITSK